MLVQPYYHFQQDLHSKGIIFSFTGYVSEGILYALGEALKQKWHSMKPMPTSHAKCFRFLLNKCKTSFATLPTVSKVRSEKVELSSGMIAVGREDNRFFVVCGNIVSQDDVTSLRDRLQQLSQMDKEALKAHYKEKLREPAEEQSRGGSIGLIEIARRASEPIQFDFMDLDNQAAFFCLKAYI